ncbi:MAG: hypothetical protein F6K21_03430 [Symploca sp. SIO2D2]|nr:hypothetical protein [Symploca sp. SIO2D2]
MPIREVDVWQELIDETGNKYGLLTVIERAGTDTDRSATWLCECECGNNKVVQGNALRQGKTRSCGCLKRQKSFIDETGNVYGKLTVIQRVPSITQSKAKWLCQCECGNYREVEGTKLRKGKITHCGCDRKSTKGRVSPTKGKTFPTKVRPNQQYGALLVLGRVPRKGKRDVIWACRCMLCGGRTEIRSSSLTSRKTKSCGCLAGRPWEKRKQKKMSLRELLKGKVNPK